MHSIYYLITSFCLCLALTPVVRYFGHQKQMDGSPSAERWHQKPTALMGGIAIYLGMSLPLLMAADFSSLLPFVLRNSSMAKLPSVCATLWVCATALFALGLVDDFVTIKPQTKLVGQILAASFISFLGFRLHWFTSLTLDTMVTIIWVVGLTNAFNLIDNMDGLCAGTGSDCRRLSGLSVSWNTRGRKYDCIHMPWSVLWPPFSSSTSNRHPSSWVTAAVLSSVLHWPC